MEAGSSRKRIKMPRSMMSEIGEEVDMTRIKEILGRQVVDNPPCNVLSPIYSPVLFVDTSSRLMLTIAYAVTNHIKSSQVK